MEINIPAAFVGVSEEDGMHNQMDFGQFLVEGAASRERDALVQSKKVIVFQPPVCPM